MAYDESTALRLRDALGTRSDIVEKKMFGGLVFLLSGNMCCGIVGDTLMVRVGADGYEEALGQPHAREMDFTGRALKGFVYVEPEGFDSVDDLHSWLERGVRFAKSLPPK